MPARLVVGLVLAGIVVAALVSRPWHGKRSRRSGMERPPRGADLGTMAAILFLVAILGLLVAGRTQAQAADGSKALFSFQLWQLAVALVLPVVCAAPDVPTIAKVIALVSTASAFSFSVFRARHAHDFDDLHF